MSREIILIVEDDEDVQNILRLYLEREGYGILSTNNGVVAVQMVKNERPDLIILDVLLPGIDGFEACRQMREITDAPILFLSCKTEESDKIAGLMLGGDDYITKPFNPNELVARVKANLRRIRMHRQAKTETLLTYNGLEIDLIKREVRVNGKSVNLSRKEFELLSFLARHPNQLFSTEVLYREVWGLELFNDSRTIIVHISNLRKKIEPNPSKPRYILNVHGVGYRFHPGE